MMRFALPLVLALFLVLRSCGPAAAQPQQDEEALAVLRKAVQAHGGAGIERLRVATVSYTMQGRFPMLFAGELDVAVDETYQLPRQIKKVIQGKVAGRDMALAWAINPTSCWHWEKGGRVEVVEQTLDVESTYRPFLIIEQLANYALLDWPTPPGTADHDPDLIALIGRSNATGTELTFSFSKTTGLLAEVASWRTMPQTPGEVYHKTQLADYEEIDGLRLPMRQTVFQDGKQLTMLRVNHVGFFERFDDSEFAPPASAWPYLAVALVFLIAGCVLVGRSLATLLRRLGWSELRAASVSAMAGVLIGAVLGPSSALGIEWLELGPASWTPGSLTLLAGLAGGVAGFIGGCLSPRPRS
jgi:hypothetical protein